MDTSIIIAILIGLLIVGGVAWAVYRAGYRATKMKVKTPIWEADLERTPSQSPTKPVAEPQVVSNRTEASQNASGGGVIHGGEISAPADSGAKLEQKAKGQGSRIDDSKIKLD